MLRGPRIWHDFFRRMHWHTYKHDTQKHTASEIHRDRRRQRDSEREKDSQEGTESVCERETGSQHTRERGIEKEKREREKRRKEERDGFIHEAACNPFR